MKELTRNEVATILENFIEGRGGTWDWDNYTTGAKFKDDELRAIQARCIGLQREFPPSQGEGYCSEKGVDVMRGYIKQLRSA